MRGEGKSTTAVNLSYVLAESGKRVLLVDCDLRIPSVAKKMQIENEQGLTDLLKGGESFNMKKFQSQHYSNWYIIPSGPLPPNPSELLGSKKMDSVLKILSENFDYIILDLPPVNIVSDALTVSKYIDGMIVVIREDYTEKKELENCFRLLKLSDVNVLGCGNGQRQDADDHHDGQNSCQQLAGKLHGVLLLLFGNSAGTYFSSAA